jgi:hypothetical protein
MVHPPGKYTGLTTLRRKSKKRNARRDLEPGSSPNGSGPLLPLRAAVLLMAAGIAAAVAAVLTYLMEHSVPTALFAGFTTAGTALSLLNGLIGQ